MKTEFQKSREAFYKLNYKLKHLEGSHGLIHAEYDMNFKTAYPAYGFSCGVDENRLEYTESFAKALRKAITLCRNFRYNGRHYVY